MAIEGKNEQTGDLAGFEIVEKPIEKTQEELAEANEEQQTPEQIEEAARLAEEKVGDEKVVEKVNEIELDDDKVSAYLKNKYKDRAFETLDDFVKVPETKEVEKNPWANEMDEEDEAYYTYKRETGRGRKEFDYLKEDIKSKDALQISMDKLRNETGLDISDNEAKSYLEKQLQIDLEDEDATLENKIALNKYAKSRRDELLAEQEKYRTPLEEKLKAKKDASVEMVKLENGNEMPKAEYDNLLNTRNEYIKNVTKAVDSVTASEFSISIDDNGDKKELKFTYDHSKEDKHSMLSDASDVDAMISKRYQTKEGFNHQSLAKGLWWAEEANQQKVVSAAMQFARAEAIKEFITNGNNENFNGKPIPTSKKTEDGYADLGQLG